MNDIRKQTVLCVDDDKWNLELLEALLSPEGYAVKFSRSGAEALILVAEEIPDLILLDIMMPGMSGLEVLERLRVEERTRLIPVVLVTALHAEEDRIKGIAAGCDDFISKPFDKSELVVRVRSLLKISYYRRSLDEKEKFEAVIQELKAGVVVCEPDWIVTRANHSAKNYLGISEGDPFLEHIFSHYSISTRRELLADLSAAPKKFDIKRENTEEFKALCLEANLDIVRHTRGEPSCMVIILRDVTQQRNMDFLAFDFLALLSHKFSTPVTVIGETLDALKPQVDKEEFRRMIGAAERQLKEIHSLSQRIIYALEIQSKGMNDVVLADFLEGAPYRAKEKLDAKYKVFGILEKDISVRTVALWKVIVLEELMENAYKFCGKKGLFMKLTFTEDSMTFSDNGVGIPPEEQQKIFEPFYQIYKEFHGRIPGLGLGLTLVKKLVELNKGKIEVKSGIGQGAVIRIGFSPPDPNAVR